ncbi:hypothetical protein HMPREF9069_01199 [Atopobium sp. oral taxon 810 str. F0209]|nr:hypothetical protein HMPREF9069_01199 [Atopobium sp. oral taxon 810 str. F0209]
MRQVDEGKEVRLTSGGLVGEVGEEGKGSADPKEGQRRQTAQQ